MPNGMSIVRSTLAVPARMLSRDDVKSEAPTKEVTPVARRMTECLKDDRPIRISAIKEPLQANRNPDTSREQRPRLNTLICEWAPGRFPTHRMVKKTTDVEKAAVIAARIPGVLFSALSPEVPSPPSNAIAANPAKAAQHADIVDSSNGSKRMTRDKRIVTCNATLASVTIQLEAGYIIS